MGIFMAGVTPRIVSHGWSDMTKIIDIQNARDSKNPHASGPARCLSCQHEWAAVVPLPLPPEKWLECPSCGQPKGSLSPFVPNESALVCVCKNVVFYATRKTLMCPVCAETYER